MLYEASWKPTQGIWETPWGIWENTRDKSGFGAQDHILHATLAWYFKQVQLLPIPELTSLLVFLSCSLVSLFVFSGLWCFWEWGLLHLSPMDPFSYPDDQGPIFKAQTLVGPWYLFDADHLFTLPWSGILITTFFLPESLAPSDAACLPRLHGSTSSDFWNVDGSASCCLPDPILCNESFNLKLSSQFYLATSQTPV